MRGGVLPPALLLSALGLALAFAPRLALTPSLLALVSGLGVGGWLPLPQRWLESVFLGCWISVVGTAASVHLTDTIQPRAVVAISLNAGFWGGAITSLSGSWLDMLCALPCLLLMFPASWATSRYSPLPAKVVSSWVMVIATLAAVLQILPVTPGYMPDHLE
jgi:hypothetical protein